jgi:hypothetical protein
VEVKLPRHGSVNLKFSLLMGLFFHAPMANPPIYASSDDARSDRGVRPLREEKQISIKDKDLMRSGIGKKQSQRQKQTEETEVGGR